MTALNLERRGALRYEFDLPLPVLIDSTIAGSVVNISETGLAMSLPRSPDRDAVLRVDLHDPETGRNWVIAGQVVWSEAGSTGLKIFEPGSVQPHLEDWLRFSKNAAKVRQGRVRPVSNVTGEKSGSSALSVEALRARILSEPEGDRDKPQSNKFSWLRWTDIIAVVALIVLTGVTAWFWHVRAKIEAGRPIAYDTAVTQGQPISPPAALPPEVSKSVVDLPPLAVETSAHTHSSVIPASAQSATQLGRSEVFLRLNRLINVTPKLLHHPDRLYLDLPSTIEPRISHAWLRAHRQLVQRARIGRREDGKTRVVIDLSQPCEYGVASSPEPPYSLQLWLRAKSSNDERSKHGTTAKILA